MSKNMKTVGLLTFHFVQNYGALLQAAALQRILSSLGALPFFIDYQPDHVERGGKLVFPKSRNDLIADAKTLYLALGRFRSFLGPNRKKKAFQRFAADHLNIGDTLYKSLADLNQTPPSADLYICGSDQIWNKSQQFGFDPAYFLNFGGNEIPKAAYAASFGKADFMTEDEILLEALLSPFSFVSVRESSGVDIVRRLSCKQAVCVPDPTILLDDVGALAGNIPDQPPYLFSYVLREGKLARNLQRSMASKLNLDIVTPPGSVGASNKTTPQFSVGPSEWVSLIQHSECVLTNSYHGTIFSILLRKPFLTVALSGRKAGYNERSQSLLSLLGLSDRIVGSSDVQNANQKMFIPIDWNTVHDKLAMLKAQGMMALRQILSL